MKTSLKNEFVAFQTFSRHVDSFSVSICLMASWILKDFIHVQKEKAKIRGRMFKSSSCF